MSKKKLIVAGAALLVAAGTVAAISATGPRGGWGERHGWQRGPGAGGDGQDGLGRRGMFQREVTKEQFDGRVRERFARLDKNSDGFIDATEIEAGLGERRGRMMERMRGGGAGEGNARPGERLLARFDTNRDGKVTKDELLAQVRKRFAERDLNSDGKISDDDLPPMMRGQNAIQKMMSGERGGRARMGGGRMGGGFGGFGEIEVKDGAVTLDAVLAAATRWFDRLDRNKDGALDKADFDALRKETVDYGVKRFLHAHGATKDGKVSREQFFAKANERFAEMDANGDGKLGRGEFGGRGMHGPRGPMGGGGDAPPRR